MNRLDLVGWIGTDGPVPGLEIFLQIIFIGGTLLSCAAAYIVLYAVQRFAFKQPKFRLKNLVVAVAVGIIVFPGAYYIREFIDDRSWKASQTRCAAEVGYSHPRENENLSIATAETQRAYHSCLHP